MAKKPEQDDVAREKVGYSLPSDLIRAVKRISFEEGAAIQEVVADALKELVVRYIAQRRPVEPVDLSSRILDLDWGGGSGASIPPPKALGVTKSAVVLPPVGSTPDAAEAVHLLDQLKQRNPILAQALSLAIVAGAREGTKDDSQSLRAASEDLDEAVLNVYRTLAEIGAGAGGSGTTAGSTEEVSSAAPGKSKRVKTPMAS